MKIGIARVHIGDTLPEIAIHNGAVFLAGQLAAETSKNFEWQTHGVLAHIDRLLAEVGSDKTRILSCQVYLAKVNDFDGMNEVWSEWVPEGHAAPRATVAVSFPNSNRLVEIIVMAATF